MLRDMMQFRRSKQRYERLGVPYHRGYLLYGPPGTGKTSLVSALAAYFGLSVYCVNLAEFDDRTLMAAVSQIPRNSVLLFEDIDCMKGGQKREAASAVSNAATPPHSKQDESSNAKNAVTLSGLLNLL